MSNSEKKVRAGVVGVGYFGLHHAKKYAYSEFADLVAVYDTDINRAQEVAKTLGCQAVASIAELSDLVDAVSVVVPTDAHFPISQHFLEKGIGVLVEKPMCASVIEGRELIGIAERKGALLQVGHVERFNPAFSQLKDQVTVPRLIEAERSAPFKERGTDVNVVLDMMIHDIDLVLQLAGSPVAKIDAVGYPIMSSEEDIAKAWIHFENGCSATVSASRVSWKKERRLKVYQENTCLDVDLDANTLRRSTRQSGAKEIEMVTTETAFSSNDNLQSEIDNFVQAVATGQAPLVSGLDGLRALETSLMINDCFGRPITGTLLGNAAG